MGIETVGTAFGSRVRKATENAILNNIIARKTLIFDKFGYYPRESQKEVHDCITRFRVVVAGRRWGKSLLASKEAEAMLLAPKTTGWIVSKTYELGEYVFREIYDNLIIRQKLPTKKKRYSVETGSMYLEFPWGSSVRVKSSDHLDSLVGEGLDWLIFDECAKCKSIAWEQYLRPALSDKNGWCLFITTPNGYNWLYDLWEKGRGCDNPDWKSFRFPTWDNPLISELDLAEARQELPPDIFNQEYGASFLFTTGNRVYTDFDETVHVIDEFEPEEGWKLYRSIDFGYEHPFVCLYIATDVDDRVYVYDEYVERHKTVEQHAERLKDDIKYEYSTADPSGASQRATLKEKGIPTIAPRSKVEEGLMLVRKLLLLRADGKPGVYISRKCKYLIEEFYSYIYGNQEQPRKEHDDCMDALRYWVVQWGRGTLRKGRASSSV